MPNTHKKKLPKEMNVDVAPAHSCFLWFVAAVLLPLADRFASCNITGRDLTSEKDVSPLFLFPQSGITGSPGTAMWDLPVIVSTLSTRNNIGSTIRVKRRISYDVSLCLSFPVIISLSFVDHKSHIFNRDEWVGEYQTQTHKHKTHTQRQTDNNAKRSA